MMGGNLVSTPWRDVQDIKWTKKWKDELYDKVKNIKLQDTESSSRLGLLVIGPSHHGKSSFINALATVSKKEKCGVANSGSDEGNLTVLYRQFKCPGGLDNFWLGDIRGFTKSCVNSGMVSDVKTLIAGHMKPGYKFIPDHPLKGTSKEYVPKPKASDQVHCVIIVYSSEKSADINQAYKAGIADISKLINLKNVPRCVVLTKCDILCEDTAKDISNIFRSKKVHTAVEKAALCFGVPKGDIHPVVNYENDLDEVPKKSIPLLLALRAILNLAHDHAIQDSVNTETNDNEDGSELDNVLQTDNK